MDQDNEYGCTTTMVTSYMFMHLLGENFIIQGFQGQFKKKE